MDTSEIESIVESSKALKIDLIRIYIHEEKGEFETCIDIYLHSPGCDKQDIFPWLRNLAKKNKVEDDSVDKIK